MKKNYDFLEKKGITPFVKYNYFDKERTDKKHRENPFNPDNLYYNAETDTYYCPSGQPMTHIGEKKRKTANGFIQTHRLYKAKNCEGCPMRGLATKRQETGSSNVHPTSSAIGRR